MRRRAVADSLAPLVDTLSNVVGILVIVLALTQIELGGALERVLRLEATQAEAEQAFVSSIPERRAALEAQAEALLDRGIPADEEGIALAEELLEALAEFEGEPPPDSPQIDEALASLSDLRRANADARRAIGDREARLDGLRRVPKERVARLPDPRVEHGRESWILVRHGRIFPVDRKGLFDAGTAALGKIFGARSAEGLLRPDELASAALYLRKRSIGRNGFRWSLESEPRLHVRLEWPDADLGIEPALLDRSVRWRTWLAARVPGRDFVRFRVWNDSFEAYGAARQAIEAAGLGAGWEGFERDRELEIPVSFGVAGPEERDIELD